jgi:hypothetical protein
MDFKRAIILSLLTVANIIVLAHVVVPHHYHEDTGVCFTFHCKDSNVAHEHEGDEPQKHQHEGSPAPDVCNIDVVYTTTEKDNLKVSFQADCWSLFFLSHVNNLFIKDLVSNAGRPLQYTSNLLSYHAEFVSQSLGLRAPPIILITNYELKITK